MAKLRENATAPTPEAAGTLSDFDTAALETELGGRADRSDRFLDEGDSSLKDALEEDFAAEAKCRNLRLVDERDIMLEDFDEMRSLAVRRDWRGLLRAIEAQLPHELQGLETGIFSAERHASEPALTMIAVDDRPFPWATMRRLPLSWVRVWYTDALSRRPIKHAHPVRLDTRRNELADAMNMPFRHREELCAGPGAPRIVGWCWAIRGGEPELAAMVERSGYTPEAAAYEIATRTARPPNPFAPDADLFG